MSFPPGHTVVPTASNFDRFSIKLGDEAHVIEYAALMQIRTHLEEEVTRQEEMWLPRDQELSTVMRTQFAQTRIERVDPRNWFIGARPSLVNTSIDFWPSVTVRSGDGRPSGEQGDFFDVLDTDLYVEVLCKAGPVGHDQLHLQPGIDAEGQVNKQVQRLSAAVHMCVRRDPTLGGIVQTIQRPPTKRASLPFAVPGSDQEGSGDYYLYAGRQLRYVIQANSY